MAEAKRVPQTSFTNPFARPHDDGFCELVLVRHGEQWYREGMTLGEGANPPLTALGQQQAAAVGARLSGTQIDAVYASPLVRALDTGKAIAGHHDLEPVVDDDLREVDLWRDGDPTKRLGEQFEADELRAIFTEAQTNRSWDAYPYGEGSASFRTRVTAAINRIIDDHHGQRVAVACHGGVISTLVAMVAHSPFDYVFPVHHTSITTMRAADERRSIHSFNDYAHVLTFQTELNPLNLH